MMTQLDPNLAVEELYRSDWGRIVATLIHYFNDFELAEDAAQEAFARAFRQWDEVAAMNRPAGWVLTVGLNYARDSFRRQRRASLHRRRSICRSSPRRDKVKR